MGNCIETCRQGSKEVQRHEELQLDQRPYPAEMFKVENMIVEKDDDEKSSGGAAAAAGAMRIKIVVTKEELEMLLFQLKSNNNNNKEEGEKRSLEDVLDEIERSRSIKRSPIHNDGPWKPSLESITESPEVPDQMDR